MPIKIFQAGGKDAIEKMEARDKQVARWLSRTACQTLTVSTATSSVKDTASDEIYQHLIVTFLYD
jgi:hypothetical protein